MMDQAQNLRKYVEEYRKRKSNKVNKKIRIIAVASGKGGVGKTNFSINVAISLREMGNRVLVFDADLGLGNVDVVIGIVPKLTLYDVIYNHKEIDDIVINGPEGIRIVPGGSGIETLANLDDMQRDNLSKKFERLLDTDILIIDTGAGISKNVLSFIAASNETIVVTTPEPTSITDAYSLIKVVLKYIPEKKINVIVNKVRDEKEATVTYKRLDTTVKKFLDKNIYNLGYIMEDARVKRSVMEQKPFKINYPNCSASKCIDNIAHAISGLPDASKSTGGIRYFLNKVTYLFSKME
ncbi:MAG: MinD/ParA family protein [Clostridiales bacterium]|nr:MinD/ParA family protein [Clostridiales bacterium]HBM81487.1 hypothetical protein [Clostridiaceae bacterium]